MTEFNESNSERTSKKRGFFRRLLAGKSLQETVEAPSEVPVELTPDGEPKSVQRVTIIDPTGEKPPETKTYRNW